ncbi:unnamed protein product [Caretta caretta]
MVELEREILRFQMFLQKEATFQVHSLSGLLSPPLDRPNQMLLYSSVIEFIFLNQSYRSKTRRKSSLLKLIGTSLRVINLRITEVKFAISSYKVNSSAGLFNHLFHIFLINRTAQDD